MPIQLFPLNGGINGQIDTRLLPDGALADAVNVELDRDGRLIGRAKYTAQAVTVYGSGTFVAYDLFRFDDRLFAFGDAHSYGFPCDIYERMPDGLAARWRPTSNRNSTTPRLPRATKVRDIARPPDQAGGISNMGCAAFGGYAALVWNSSDDANDGYINVVAVAENQPVVFEQLAEGLLRAIALSDRFLFIGVSSGVGLHISRFIPATDTAVAAVATIAVGSVTTYAACKVAGSDQFVVAYNVGGTITVERRTAAGVSSGVSYATFASAATRIAVEASSTANQIVVITNVAGTCTIRGYNLTTGAAIGNSTAFSGETCVEMGLVRTTTAIVKAFASVTSETAPTVFCANYTVSTNSFGSSLKCVTDAQLATTPVFTTEFFYGVRVGADGVGGTPNLLISSGTTDDEDVTPQICKDFEVAGVTSALLPDVTQDSSTGKYYWCNASANPDSDLTPVITEFELNSTERRQVTQFGEHLYIAGGVPLVFDGMTAVESGFLVRPRIISLTGSNGSGDLIGGAEYDYRLHQEWIDSRQDLHLSPVSKISTVELGASHDTVDAVTTTALSMRRNGGNNDRGGVVRNVLSRTLATVSHTTATLTGTKSLDPPEASLTGLGVRVLSIVAGVPVMNSAAFTAAATSLAVIVQEINAAFTNVTATAVAGVLQFTSDTPGETATIMTLGLVIYGGTANAILGFPGITRDTGTTTYTKGENFQRAASDFTGPADAVAAYLTVTDLRKDQSDPIVDADLIRQQPLYSQGIASGSHHSPPPSEYVAAGRERVAFLGQPRRGRGTLSKLAAPGEPIECAAEGFISFGFASVGGEIEAGAFVGDSIVLWTLREIWEVSGSGPGRNGVGEFFAARRITKDGGIIANGWRSIVETGLGVFFQRASDQLCLLTRAGAIEWVGRNIQSYLVLYPVITAAVYVATKHTVAFACTNSAGTTGGILRYDLESKAWFFDNVGACSALSEFQGRIAYVQAGIVYVQDETPGSGTFVPYHVDSGMFQGFQLLGYGQLNKLGALLTYRDECTVNIYLSEDGTTFPTLHASWDLTDSEYDPGDRVVLLKEPAIQMRDSWAVRLEVTHDAADSEGAWLHAWALDTSQSPELVRKGAAHNL